MKPIQLETERTWLRQLTPEDANDFYALNLDPEVIRYTGDQPFASPAEAEKFLQEYDQYEKHGTGRLAVIEKESRRFIGWCGLKYTPELQEYDLGFRFFRQYWNRGFATETAMACLDFGFNQLNLDTIVGRAMHANKGSIRVLEKIGMSFVKEVEFELHAGVLYRVSRDEYQKRLTMTSNFKLTIRNAKPEEFSAIGRLMVDVYSLLDGFPKESDQPDYYKLLLNVGALTQKPCTEILVAVNDVEQLLGAVVYFSDMQYYGSGGTATAEKNAAGFRLLTVAPSSQKQGIGKLLTLACIEKARERKLQQVIIHTTQAMLPAWKMYEKLGFKRSEDLDFLQQELPVFGFRLKL